MSFICHIHNYTEYNQQWNVFSAFNPSKCTHTWSSGQPTLRHLGSSWGFSALLKGLTSVMDNSCRSRDSNPQPRVTSPTIYPLEPRPPREGNQLCLTALFFLWVWVCVCVCVCPISSFCFNLLPLRVPGPPNDSSAGRLPESIQLTPQEQNKNVINLLPNEGHT